MPHHIDVIDAFADAPFSGNPAAVVHLPPGNWPADSWLADVAAEMKHAETAFLIPLQPGQYGLRWFTPEVEVDLCGHATLASAHSLFTRLGGNAPTVFRFQTRSGELTAAKVNSQIQLNFPVKTGVATTPPANLLDALGVKAVNVLKNDFDYLVELTDEAAVRSATPDFRLLNTVQARGVIITARAKEYDFISRFFAPTCGIDEDPVTGSAHCFLAPFWGEKLKKTTMRGYQASRRGGVVHVTMQGERVLLQGNAQLMLRGEFLAKPQ